MSKLPVFLALFFATTSWAVVPLGGLDGGGGNSCFLPTNGGRPVLLALTNLPPSLLTQGKAGVSLPLTRNMRDLTIDSLDLTAEPMRSLVAAADAALARQQTTNPDSVRIWRTALRGLVAYVTPLEFQKPWHASYTPGSACQESNTRAVAAYANNFVIFSAPLFSAMDFTNQTGVLLTESLRQVQYLYGGRGSDQELQDLVRLVLFPSGALRLDASPFFQPLLARPARTEETCNRWRALQNARPTSFIPGGEGLMTGIAANLNVFCGGTSLTQEQSLNLMSQLHGLRMALTTDGVWDQAQNLSRSERLRYSQALLETERLYNSSFLNALGAINNDLQRESFDLQNANAILQHRIFRDLLASH